MLRPASRLCAVIAVLCPLLTPLPAQAEWRRIATLSERHWAGIRQAAVRRGPLSPLLNEAIPYFKVPAQDAEVLVCENRGLPGLECWIESRGRTCPSEVEVRIPGVPTPARVPVTCIGPDVAGECECDFAQG